jgi:hypothetical protein
MYIWVAPLSEIFELSRRFLAERLGKIRLLGLNMHIFDVRHVGTDNTEFTESIPFY